MQEPRFFYEDEHLAELIRSAEKYRRWYWRIDWFKVGVWLGCLAFCGLFWWGVARAIDMGALW